MVDEDTKWKMSELRQMQTADPVGMGRKSCLSTILEYSVLTRLYTHTEGISCLHLPQFSRLPFCVQLLNLWHGQKVAPVTIFQEYYNGI